MLGVIKSNFDRVVRMGLTEKGNLKDMKNLAMWLLEKIPGRGTSAWA